MGFLFTATARTTEGNRRRDRTGYATHGVAVVAMNVVGTGAHAAIGVQVHIVGKADSRRDR